MQTESIIVADFSCDGCVSIITKEIMAIIRVEKVVIDLKTNNVFFNRNGYVNRQVIKDSLLFFGYLKATEENVLLTHLKSIVNCLFSKIFNSIRSEST